MRHRVRGRKLGRTNSHRKAMFGNLMTSLFRFHRVTTTHAKAMEARRFAERLITYAKTGSLHARRLAARVIHDKKILRKLFTDIAPVYKERNGGYTRVLKVGERRGDAALLSILELVGIDPHNREGVVPYSEKRVKPKPDTGRKKKSTPVRIEEKRKTKDKAERAAAAAVSSGNKENASPFPQEQSQTPEIRKEMDNKENEV